MIPGLLLVLERPAEMQSAALAWRECAPNEESLTFTEEAIVDDFCSEAMPHNVQDLSLLFSEFSR